METNQSQSPYDAMRKALDDHMNEVIPKLVQGIRREITLSDIRDIVREEMAILAIPGQSTKPADFGEYTLPEAAKYLRVATSSVYKFVSSGRLKSTKRGMLLFFTKAQLDEFNEARVNPKSNA